VDPLRGGTVIPFNPLAHNVLSYPYHLGNTEIQKRKSTYPVLVVSEKKEEGREKSKNVMWQYMTGMMYYTRRNECSDG